MELFFLALAAALVMYMFMKSAAEYVMPVCWECIREAGNVKF
jgi:hypothetical protein